VLGVAREPSLEPAPVLGRDLVVELIGDPFADLGQHRSGIEFRREPLKTRRRGAVAKYLLAGADDVMTASALLPRNRVRGRLLDGLSGWMARKGFRSVDDLRGMLSVPHDVDQATYERTGYIRALRAANARAHAPW
jgi:hypothetical protein